MNSKPKYLIPPCRRSKSAIIAWLESMSDPRGWQGDGNYLFCFNVKVYHVDFSFDNLLKRYREAGELGQVSERWLAEARKLLPENESNFWEWAIEDARRGVTDDDAWKTTWAGKDVRAEWGFYGRSGGWLCLESFNGYCMSPHMVELSELDYQMLVDLAEMIQWASHWTQRDRVRRSVEECAAFAFFNNICEAEIESDADEKDRLEKERLEKERLEKEEAFRCACADILTV